MYNRRYTPERISELKDNEIFVFGSNLAGAHGGGAAWLAFKQFGAVWGEGVGMYGQTYAIPTMQGGVETIKPYVDDFIRNANSVDVESDALTVRERLIFAKEQVIETFKKVFPYILVGVGIGAIIHNWIPESWIQTVLGSNNPFGVVLAVLVGVPMYADIFGTIPVAEALLAKGAQLGTILSFMMAVTTLSLPSIIMLKKAVKPKLLVLFIVICTLGIVIVGYLFNVFQYLLI